MARTRGGHSVSSLSSERSASAGGLILVVRFAAGWPSSTIVSA